MKNLCIFLIFSIQTIEIKIICPIFSFFNIFDCFNSLQKLLTNAYSLNLWCFIEKTFQLDDSISFLRKASRFELNKIIVQDQINSSLA